MRSTVRMRSGAGVVISWAWIGQSKSSISEAVEIMYFFTARQSCQKARKTNNNSSVFLSPFVDL
jgi:hypothetical protein